MQKVKVKGHSVQKFRVETDRRMEVIAITSRGNVVSKNKLTQLCLYLSISEQRNFTRCYHLIIQVNLD